MKKKPVINKFSIVLLLAFYLVNLQAHTHLHLLADQHHANESVVIIHAGSFSNSLGSTNKDQKTHSHDHHCDNCVSEFDNVYIKTVKSVDSSSDNQQDSPTGRIYLSSPVSPRHFLQSVNEICNHLSTPILSDRAPPLNA